MNPNPRILLIDLLPFAHSTRTRKFGRLLAQTFGTDSVKALTLDRAGRLGISSNDRPPVVDNVSVSYIQTRKVNQSRSIPASFYNLLIVYGLAILRMLLRTVRTRCDVLFVGHMSLFWLGVLHSMKYGSTVVLNARERPGAIRTRGSLGAWFSRIEPLLLRAVSRHHRIVVVSVAPSHAEAYRALGFANVLTIRNVPDDAFVLGAPHVPIVVNDTLDMCYLGSLYPGRGLEPLFGALANARGTGRDIRLLVSGRGGEAYLRHLRDMVDNLELQAAVEFLGECEPSQVRQRYEATHLGLALYEDVDRANDSLSNKIFESVASGRPVLAGDLPENRAFVEQNRVGWLSPVTVPGLTDALNTVYDARDSLSMLAVHCSELSQKEFYWSREASVLVSTLREVQSTRWRQ